MTTSDNDLKAGNMAPSLVLPDGLGEKVSLDDYRGKWVVLYFYPKDDTPGCTTEALDFTARQTDFERHNAVILGVSPDSPKSHCDFTEKHGLSVRLLSDEEKTALDSFGVWRKKRRFGRESMGVVRTTFLIDPTGRVAHVWNGVKVEGHADDVLSRLNELSSE